MPTDYVNTETSHLDHHSIFYNIKLPNNEDLLEAIKIWELTADAKYIDILGYGCSMLYKSVAPRDYAKIEVDKIDTLLKTGSCELLTGYGDFDLEQIPFGYQAMLTGRWDDFISLSATRAYLDSDQDVTMIDYYFSRKWVVATQVQALIWYKEFLLNVEKNGITFREDKSSTNDDKTFFENSSSDKNTKESNLVRPINILEKKDDWYELIKQAHEEYSEHNKLMHTKKEFFNWIGSNQSFCNEKKIKAVKDGKERLTLLVVEWENLQMDYERFSKKYDSCFKLKKIKSRI